MAQQSWPYAAYNSGAVTDVEYEALAARFSDDGVYGDPLTSGAVVSAGTGLNVNISPEVYASVRGHAWYSGTTTVTLAVAANSSGSTRIDRVVLRLNRSDWTVQAVVKQGTPGSGPPALTRDEGDTGVWEIRLADVTVLNGAAAVSVTRNELYVGSRIRPCTSTTRTPTPRRGELCFEADTGRISMWNGAAWKTVYSDSGLITLTGSAAPWTVQTESVLQVRSGIACLRLGSFERTSGGTLAGSEASRLPINIPAAYRHPNRDQYATVYIEGIRIGRITVYSDNSSRPGQVWLTQHPDIRVGEAVVGASISWVVD